MDIRSKSDHGYGLGAKYREVDERLAAWLGVVKPVQTFVDIGVLGVLYAGIL